MKKLTVINYFGSAQNLAEFLGLHKSAVSQWGEIIPEKQALKLAHLTEGKLIYTPVFYKKSSTV
jgi:DNA-binding transcriptional regulator YdaS (Cro superfamily)